MAPPRYWLMKSEPDVYGIDDLKRDGRGEWDGVRNFKARNYMRDDMKVGDLVLFYHSNAKPPGVAGIARVCKEAIPDHTSWDPGSKYFDKRSKPEKPLWWMVVVEYVDTLPDFVPLGDLRENPKLDGMLVIKRGMRLSIQPVEKKHFDEVLRMGGATKTT